MHTCRPEAALDRGRTDCSTLTFSPLPAMVMTYPHAKLYDHYCGEQIYRVYVLNKLPQLHDLDMTTVTEADRAQAAAYRRFNPPRTKKKKTD